MVWDVEGKQYFDWLSAYSAVNQVRCGAVRILRVLRGGNENLESSPLKTVTYRCITRQGVSNTPPLFNLWYCAMIRVFSIKATTTVKSDPLRAAGVENGPVTATPPTVEVVSGVCC